jgi:nucleoside-diphosphate-sugar epimerase
MEKKTVALTGASGNMGRETLAQLASSDAVGKIKLLLLKERREKRLAAKWKKKYGDRLEIIFGNIGDRRICDELVKNADYVLNLAAVIPPKSDSYPEKARICNVEGARNIVAAVESITVNQPKLVHISTVAVYGNRNYVHPWGRVGDPLLPSVYDCYASYKTIGERFVLDSGIKSWAVLRQTAMLHNRMLADNMSDGLMFHTCYNVPLEWVTARDSGRLMTRIVERDSRGEVDSFWKKVYNIGGGAPNRCTGYDTFDQGFGIIGGSVESFMRPTWNSIRNFHGMWFSDSGELQNLFDFQREKMEDYWKEILETHKIYSLGKIVPPPVISKFAVQRLLKNANSPRKWVAGCDEGKVRAYFGSRENLDCLPSSWKDYPVLAKGQLADADVDYDEMRDITKVKEHGYILSHGYDESKPDSELSIEDMREAAAFRGGKCLSETMVKGDLYTKLEWECRDGHKFSASPYTVLKAGHWCPVCCEPGAWDFDRLAKFMPFFAQVWYDTHAKKENCKYYFNKDHRAEYEIYR